MLTIILLATIGQFKYEPGGFYSIPPDPSLQPRVITPGFELKGSPPSKDSPPEKSGDDPSGFVNLLNTERQRRGLGSVRHDPSLVNISAQNNQFGVGHAVTGGFRQCSAGAYNSGSALQMWLSSGAHAAIILAPDITFVGFSTNNGFASVTAR